LEQLGLLGMLSAFVAQGEGVTSQGTPYLPGDTVINEVAHGEAAMPMEERLDLAEEVRPTLRAPGGLAEGTEALALDMACTLLP
jgi:hypothetical protein